MGRRLRGLLAVRLAHRHRRRVRGRGRRGHATHDPDAAVEAGADQPSGDDRPRRERAHVVGDRRARAGAPGRRPTAWRSRGSSRSRRRAPLPTHDRSTSTAARSARTTDHPVGAWSGAAASIAATRSSSRTLAGRRAAVGSSRRGSIGDMGGARRPGHAQRASTTWSSGASPTPTASASWAAATAGSWRRGCPTVDGASRRRSAPRRSPTGARSGSTAPGIVGRRLTRRGAARRARGLRPAEPGAREGPHHAHPAHRGPARPRDARGPGRRVLPGAARSAACRPRWCGIRRRATGSGTSRRSIDSRDPDRRRGSSGSCRPARGR